MLPVGGTVAIVALLFLDRAGCATVSGPDRERRQANDLDNTIVEVFNDCKCVFYYQCDDNNYIITSGETIFNVRFKENASRIPCKGGRFENEIICCKFNRTEAASSTTETLTADLKHPDDIIPVTEIINENNVTTVKPPKKIKCGSHRTAINVRIFAGEDELLPMVGEFPWIVAIFRKTDEHYKFHCSGSLIHPKVVLTATHCIHRKRPHIFKVILNGQIAIPSLGKNTKDERDVTDIVHHPDYYSGGLFNDISLMILNEPYVPSKENYINTICLPPKTLNLENTRCLVAGWGKDSEGEGKKTMKKVELPFVEYNRCQDLLRRTRLSEYFNLHKSFMCAGGELGKDACNGDGGSPLMCPLPDEPGRYFQMGIVSWGVGCGEVDVPGVYTNVHQFTDWITEELERKGLSL